MLVEWLLAKGETGRSTRVASDVSDGGPRFGLSAMSRDPNELES